MDDTIKQLGKIESVYFGIGGYNDAMLGIFFTFSFDGCGIGSSKCAWDANTIEWTERCKWTEQERSSQYDEIMRYVSKLLKDAKCSKISELKGKPVEISLKGMNFDSFRILTEVL